MAKSNIIKLPPKVIDLTGQSFGRWHVLRFDSLRRHKAHWFCQCGCGKTKIVNGDNLRLSKTRSCGCLSREITANRARSHGKSWGLTWRSWQSMIQRCTNPKTSGWKRYGGRGITVCLSWLDSFENFLNDMGERLSRSESLERKDNSRGYFKQNCYWANPTEQARNRRSNRIIFHDGKRKPLVAWAEHFGLNYKMLHKCLQKCNGDFNKAVGMARNVVSYRQP